MGPLQGVKGQGWIEVVLGVEGHVPHQPAQRRQRVGGAGVAQAVGHKWAAAVLGHQHKAQQRLANGQGQQPKPETKAIAAG